MRDSRSSASDLSFCAIRISLFSLFYELWILENESAKAFGAAARPLRSPQSPAASPTRSFCFTLDSSTRGIRSKGGSVFFGVPSYFPEKMDPDEEYNEIVETSVFDWVADDDTVHSQLKFI